MYGPSSKPPFFSRLPAREKKTPYDRKEKRLVKFFTVGERRWIKLFNGDGVDERAAGGIFFLPGVVDNELDLGRWGFKSPRVRVPAITTVKSLYREKTRVWGNSEIHFLVLSASPSGAEGDRIVFPRGERDALLDEGFVA